MRGSRIGARTATGAVLGLLAGAAAVSVLLGTQVSAASPPEGRATVERALRDVLHTPPLLFERGRMVDLTFDAVCQSDAFGAPCALSGTAYVRLSGRAAFVELPLVGRGESGLTASLGPSLTSTDAISYYAVIRDGAGESMTVPAGGATAPLRAWALQSVETVQLGTHAYGRTRAPDRFVLHADWGSSTGSLGVSIAKNQATIGPSAFAVAPDRSVVVLDQVNGRLVRYRADGTWSSSRAIPFAGGEGDLAVGEDGTTYVLDVRAESSLVRAFHPDGTASGTTPVAASGADMIRPGPGGFVVHGFPGDLWFPVVSLGAALLPGAQTRAATPARPLPNGAEVVVHGAGDAATFALVRGQSVLHAWRVESTTPLGEIQLVEPFGNGLVAVVRVWTEERAEFVALVLRPGGASSFAIDAVEWAESAALGRFRLAGSTLFQLRSSRNGADIVFFELGGAR
jgi:hypothetical protein